METEDVEITFKGQPYTIQVRKDIPWGDFNRLLDIILDMGKNGPNNKSVSRLLTTLIDVGLENSPIDTKDRTALMQLNTLEVTEIIGRIISVLPLEKYLTNLGLSEEGGVLPGIARAETT